MAHIYTESYVKQLDPWLDKTESAPNEDTDQP